MENLERRAHMPVRDAVCQCCVAGGPERDFVNMGFLFLFLFELNSFIHSSNAFIHLSHMSSAERQWKALV